MTKPLSKTYEAEYKVFLDDAGAPTGKVQYYASVFNNVDLVGDRVMPGAFEDSLKSWRESGDPIPVVFSHNWGDPFAIIGYADPFDCMEDSKGLLVTATLDIHDNPTALQAFKLMQRRIVKEASFSYDVESEKRAKDGANNLFKLNILETGPCLKGANPLTDTISAKSRDIKSLLQGSVEERQAALGYAAAAKFGGGTNGTWVYVEGTYSDHIIVAVMKDEAETVFYAVPYQVTPEGDITLGAEQTVELATEVRPADGTGPGGTITTPKAIEVEAVEAKSDETPSRWNRMDEIIAEAKATADAEAAKLAEADGEKAGARNSAADQAAIQSAHDALVSSGAVCAVPEVDPLAESKGDVSIEVDASVEEGGADHDEDDVKSLPDYAQLAKDFAELGDVDGELAALEKAIAAKADRPIDDLPKDPDGEKAAEAEGEKAADTEAKPDEETDPDGDGDKPADEDKPADDDKKSAEPDGEKAAEKSPPWHVEERDGKFVVILDETGEVIEGGEHETRQEAEDHVAALYANAEKAAEPDGEKAVEADTDLPEGTESGSKSIEPEGSKAAEDGPSDGSVVKPDEQGVECPQCEGTGKVPDGDGQKDCPKCKGTGRIPKDPSGGSDDTVPGKSDKESEATDAEDEAEGKDKEPESAKSEDPAESKARVAADIAEMERLLG